MLKRSITYTDYNGVERTEDFFFNLTKAELMEMEMGTYGTLTEKLKRIIKSNDIPEIMEIFKSIILKAYGEKSDDGKRFIKVDENGNKLATQFAQTEAYSNLYVELATDSKKASEFVNGLIPAGLEISEKEEQELRKELGFKEEKVEQPTLENKSEN